MLGLKEAFESFFANVERQNQVESLKLIKVVAFCNKIILARHSVLSYTQWSVYYIICRA
jgi:hypothetical protein